MEPLGGRTKALEKRAPARREERDYSHLSNIDLCLLASTGPEAAADAKKVLLRLYLDRQGLAAVLEALPDPEATGFEEDSYQP